MKSLKYFFYTLTIFILPATLVAQTRSIDLQAIVVQPKNHDTVVVGHSFSYEMYIKNNGPDDVVTSDTLEIAYSGGSSAFLLLNQTINAHDSILALNATPSTTAPGTLPICFAVVLANDLKSDPDTLNNIMCDTIVSKWPTAVSGLTKQAGTFGLYPNPAKNTVTCAYASSGDDPMLLQIMDVSGKAVLTKTFERLTAGENDLQIDISSISTGIYFVAITQGAARTMDKLVVQ